MKYPLVDGSGNFGSRDGDAAAAMRYTEARMSQTAELMLQDIDKDTVDYTPNYDDSEMEPTVLPTKFPQLLANGNMGIAVGMASSFAPHKVSDIYKAVDKILEDMLTGNDTIDDDIIDIIQAPDFPTGGIIVNASEIRQAYKNGRGRITIRSKYDIENIGKGKEAIVVTEIPFQVNKKNLVNSIADLSKEILPDIQEVRDESSREGIRIVIELKKGANTDWILNNLFKKTQLQSNFSINHTALIDGHPRMNISLKKLVEVFVMHCINVNTRKITYDLNKVQERKHVVDGIIAIMNDLDNALTLIKASKSKKETIQSLIDAYTIDEIQANAIADLRLWLLNEEGITKYQNEYDELSTKVATYTHLLDDILAMIEYTREDLRAISTRFNNEQRLTEIAGDLVSSSGDQRDYIKNESIVITLSHNGLVKSVRSKDYVAQKRGGKGSSTAIKDNDFIEQVISPLSTHDDLLIAMNSGRIVMLPAYKLPIVSKNSSGKYIQNYIKINEGEKIISIIGLNHKNDYSDINLLMVSKYGYGKRMSLESLPKTANGASCMSFHRTNDILVSCSLVENNSSILSVTLKGTASRCPIDQISVQGRNAGGVRLAKLKEDENYIVSSFSAKDDDNFVVILENGLASVKRVSDISIHNRGCGGVLCTKTDSKTGNVVEAIVVNSNDDLFIITDSGKSIRTPISSVSTQGRGAKGVRIVNLEADDHVTTASLVPAEEEESPNE